MSNQTTYRFFVHNKRVATAIFWNTGSKHMSPILEVFPKQEEIVYGKKHLQLTFHSEEEWRQHCLQHYVPKQQTHIDVKKNDKTGTNTYRFFVNDKRVATAIYWAKEERFLEVFPLQQQMVHPRPGKTKRLQLTFGIKEAWIKHCERNYNPKPTTRFEVTKKEVKEIPTTSNAPPVFVPKTNWICPHCGLGPGNDHRMCICRGYNFSVEAWEIAVGLRAPESDDTPPAPTYPAPTEVPSSVTTRQAAAEAINQNDWRHKEVFKFTAPAGKYYIGDLCYALSDDLYDAIFGDLGGYDSGLYQKKDSTDFFMVDNTAYGDGMYGGTDGKEFAVDAGIIGICPASMIGQGAGREKDGDGGHIYEFKEPVKCKFGGGRFVFKSGYFKLVIDTCGDDDEEY